MSFASRTDADMVKAVILQFLHLLVHPLHSSRDFYDSKGQPTLIACSCGKIWYGTKDAYAKRNQAQSTYECLVKMGPPFKQEDFDAIDRLKERLTHDESNEQ